MTPSFLKNLNYKFKNESLLTRALTHAGGLGPNNERLEFLGDRVLGLVVSQALLERFADENEGKIAKRLARLVSSEILAQVAKNIDLPANIIFYKNNLPAAEKDSLNVIADSLEALIAAIYLDAGLEQARKFIITYWQDFLQNNELPFDAKSALQEISQEKFALLPSYEILEKTGSEHSPKFKIRVSIKGFGMSEAVADSKKKAEKMAAEKLLEKIKNG